MNNKFLFILFFLVGMLGCDQRESLKELKTYLETQPDSSVIRVYQKEDNYCLINFMKCDSCYHRGKYYGGDILVVLKDTTDKAHVSSQIETFCNERNRSAKIGQRTVVIKYDNDVGFGVAFTDFYFYEILKINPETEFDIVLNRDKDPIYRRDK